jgi:DNA-binding winged helix-turn-helix (wHTH) protein
MPALNPTIRFDHFDLDLATGELRRSEKLVHLAPQPTRILSLLASRNGHLVTREEIKKEVWGNDIFVDFEHGLNFCIRQIRTALGDDAEKPRDIETLPSRGYRWEQLDKRVHRWKNLGTVPEPEFNTFIVPEGSPITDTLTSQHCGPPTVVTECQRGGWTSFDFPHVFADQKACVDYVRKQD